MSSTSQPQTTPILKKPKFIKVRDLKPGTSGHNLIVKVVSVDLVVNKPRVDGTSVTIAECLLGDETGCIIFTARNDQVSLLKPGLTLVIRNGKIDLWRGFMRLVVDRWGKLIPLTPDTPKPSEIDGLSTEFEANMSINFSTVEYVVKYEYI
eukprot:GEZU01009426.1.p1 GENE.GEZU01009426.1~~GEZU01009426.1.p1  ORF type:complete len:151 (+),score=19.70 GEZU01009426.1:270-722(+)